MPTLGLSILSSTGLDVTLRAEDWCFLLRRADFMPEPAFDSYHGQPVGGLDVARFLPHWSALEWTPVPDSLLSHSESGARDGRYRINIRALPGSSKRHADVIAAFVRFMSAR